jgi:NADP-dependent 3-hydroxy acid dehydrogenase YdfG
MLPLEVTSAESVTLCVSAVLEQARRIDVLVKNAGAGLLGAKTLSRALRAHLEAQAVRYKHPRHHRTTVTPR